MNQEVKKVLLSLLWQYFVMMLAYGRSCARIGCKCADESSTHRGACQNRGVVLESCTSLLSASRHSHS